MVKKRLLLGLLALAATGLALRTTEVATFRLDHWLGLIDSHPIASPVLFVPVYVAAMLAFIPTLPLNLLAGALWGPVLGSAVALAGSVLGAVLAFTLARGFLGRPFAQRFDRHAVVRLQRQFARHDWKIVAFVRLNPIFPGQVNFLFGLTSITVWTYVWSTTLFLIPLTITFAIIGSSIGALALDRSVGSVRNPLLVVGASLLFLAVCALAFGGRRAMRAPKRHETFGA